MCRGGAALLVVFFHNSVSIFGADKYWGDKPFGNVFDFGHAGVYFFFVLSGFIIAHVHQRDLGRGAGQVAGYLLKRFIRVYPVYWLVLFSILPFYFLFPSMGMGFEKNASTIISSFLLMHLGSDNTVLTVAWTLYHELLFYVLFSVAIANRRLGFSVLAAWLVLCIFEWSSGTPLRGGVLLSPLNILFFMGIMSARLLRTGSIPMPAIMAVAGASLFLACGVEEVYVGLVDERMLFPFYGIGSVLIIVGLAVLETNGRFRTPNLLEFVGEASYSIYLTHFPLLSIFAKLFFALKLNAYVSPSVAYLFLVLLCVACGGAFHVLVEKPLLQWLSSRTYFRRLTQRSFA